MRMTPAVRTLRHLAWLCTWVAVPAAAGTPNLTAGVPHHLATVWVPATVYGLTLIVAYNKIEK